MKTLGWIAAVLAAVALAGFVLPFMVSARDDVLPVVAFIAIIAGIVCVVRFLITKKKVSL